MLNHRIEILGGFTVKKVGISAMKHYRCITCSIPLTCKTRFTDTATLIPHNIPIPTSTLKEHVKNLTSYLIYVLNKKKNPIPELIYSEFLTTSLEQIVTLLNRNVIPEIIEKSSSQVILCTFEGEETQREQSNQVIRRQILFQMIIS